MVIQRLGQYCTKLQVGDQVIGINSPSKDSIFKTVRFGSQVALQSLAHPDFNGTDNLQGKADNDCYTVRGPGEYEISDIFIHAFATRSSYGGRGDQINTLYSILFDGINIVYIGPLTNTDIPEEAQEDLYQADIIFIPIGGGDVLGSEEAYNFVKKFSPRVVIPIGYDENKNKADLKAFTAHFGEHAQSEDKLTIKKKDVEHERMDVVVLAEQK
ncbi:MAG: MBL fold metallo-hydrolase [Patescibacteria group bacterium]